MGLELRVVISANINLPIAVILKKKLSLYDLQKPRYEYANSRPRPKKGVVVFWKSAWPKIN